MSSVPSFVLAGIVLLAGAVHTSDVAAVEVAAGGSNYNWYHLDRPQTGTCNREPYGVVANFHDAQSRIVDQLAQMIQSGQQRLRIGIFHGHGLNTGTVMDSTGGDLSPQNRSNFAALLAAVKRAGFAEIEVAFHPVGPNWAPGWGGWNEGLFQENWNLISNLRPIISAAGIPYRIDLHNEAIPAPNQPVLLEYAKRLWASYTSTFGRGDTVGFSVIGDEPARIAMMPQVYGDTQPYLFDLHFYGGVQDNEYLSFLAAHDQMKQLGYVQGWIIGEAYYNDPIAADRLRAAIHDTGRTVYYLTQWPLTRARTCPDVDVAPPTAFDAYVRAGFGVLPPPASPPAPPPLTVQKKRRLPTLEKRRIRVGRDGRVVLRLRCPQGTTPCVGRSTLRVGRRALGARRFSLAAGTRVARRIGLPKRLRRSLRRRGRLAAKVVLTVNDGGRVRRRVAKVTLLPAARAARKH
jgi:hypothetical protein